MKVSTVVTAIERGDAPLVTDNIAYGEGGDDGLNIFPVGGAGPMFAMSVADWHRTVAAVEDHLRKRAADRHGVATEGCYLEEGA